MINVKQLSYSDLKKANNEYMRRRRLLSYKVKFGMRKSSKHIGRKPLDNDNLKQSVFNYEHRSNPFQSMTQFCRFNHVNYYRLYYRVIKDRKEGLLNGKDEAK